LFGKKRPDGFKVAGNDPLWDEHETLDRLLTEWIAAKKTDLAPVLTADRDAQARMFRAVLARMQPLLRPSILEHLWEWWADGRRGKMTWSLRLLQQILEKLVRRKLPVDEADVAKLLELRTGVDWHHDVPVSWNMAAGFAERWVKTHEVTPVLRDRIETAIRSTSEWDYHEIVKLRRRLGALIHDAPVADGEFRLGSDEPWALAVRGSLVGLSADWLPLLQHATTARGARASKRWRERARTLVAALGEAEAAARLTDWLTQAQQGGLFGRDDDADTLRGLVWIAGELPGTATLLGDLGIFAYHKVPDWGPRSVKTGNACIAVLGSLEGLDGAAQLARLRQRVRYPSARKLIEKALDATAVRAGLTRDDVEEMSVPHFGFDTGGRWEVALGDARARVEFVSAIDPQVRWESGGKTRKSVPAAVKRDHAGELKDLRAEAKELKSMMPALRDRIEAMILEPREWDAGAWRERYADHPLLRHVARRLIWRSGGTAVGFSGATLVDVDDTPAPAASPVSLWSPIGCDVAEVEAWREWLERHEVTQPFKQAHREIYVLTPAERETKTYSNRFANHILKQHQLAALCRQRGWNFTLIGQWDSLNYPTKDLAGGWRAEFRVDSVEFDAPTSPAGIYLYVASDHVAFHRGGRERQPLTDVPPHVFSEVMRDVDLFVAVASIGNDPALADREQHPELGDYWHAYSFGDLSESGKGRRDVLARIVPRLGIADRCTLEDRYLEVRGDLRTYRIHLGSSNILMEPGSEYLCIVPAATGRRADAGLLLPFEGDQRLDVILSKAFLLANDRSIKDASILEQIRRR